MENERRMTFGIYSRKSKWTGKGESIENQIQLCRDYIEHKFDGVADKRYQVYEDEGFSGKNTTRPEFQRMLADIRSRKLDCIVCYRLDRISRSVGDFAKTIEEFDHYRIDFICIKEQFDTSTPMGKAMMNIAAVFAQLERETIAERIKDNMLILARTGRWLGGATPLGFQSRQIEKVLDDGKMRVSYKLSPVAEELKLVELIYSKFLQKQSVTAVETYLLKLGAKTRNGRDFVALSIKDILSNPVYCVADEEAYDYFAGSGSTMGCEQAAFDGQHGVSAYNRTTNEGKYQSRRPIQEWIIAAGKHKGLVPGAEWIKVQQILYKNRMYRFQYNPKNKTSLLSGLIYCKSCGTQMRPRIDSNSRPDALGFKKFSYMCDLKRRSNRVRCAASNLPGNQLDKMVCELIAGYNNVSGGVIREKLREMETHIASGNTTLRKQIEVTKDAISGKQREVGNLIRLLSKDAENEILHRQIIRQTEELVEEIHSLEAHLSKLEKEERTAISLDEQMRSTLSALTTFEGTFHLSTPLEKRELLHSIVERVEWDGQKVHIYMHGERQEQCSY